MAQQLLAVRTPTGNIGMGILFMNNKLNQKSFLLAASQHSRIKVSSDIFTLCCFTFRHMLSRGTVSLHLIQSTYKDISCGFTLLRARSTLPEYHAVTH